MSALLLFMLLLLQSEFQKFVVRSAYLSCMATKFWPEMAVLLSCKAKGF
jgi:hypothetical protein